MIKIKNKEKDNRNLNNQKAIDIAFNIIAIFSIVLFCIAIAPKSFQNDTFYTIKIGQLIRKNGIDFQEHFSWISGLNYSYPHWLYDVITSFIYDYLGGYAGIYIATMVLSAFLGIALFKANKIICKNELISFFMTLVQIYLMGSYIAARAQLVTFILFVLEIIFIEKFLETGKYRYAIGLVILPILIANLHAAVFPFYFVLYLPYLGQYIVTLIIDAHIVHKIKNQYINFSIRFYNNKLKKASKEDAKKFQKKLANCNKKLEIEKEKFEKFLIKENDKLKEPYKIKIERNKNNKKLFFIMLLCTITGLLTPLKDIPYTYTIRTAMGNTMKNINEHLPLTLIENKPILVYMFVTLSLLIFTKVKVTLKDIFMLFGLILLAFMSRRQVSMLVLFGGMITTKIISDLLKMYDKEGTRDFISYLTTIFGEAILILFMFVISYAVYKNNIGADYIKTNTYPVEATKWIKENLDYKNIKLFNDYNYGSYLLLNDIPVFIDSRCDLYTPEFNGTYNKEKKKFEGKDIFTDYINTTSLSKYYEDTFKEYGITHVITKSKSKLNMLLSKDSNYDLIYKDENFKIYKRNVVD